MSKEIYVAECFGSHPLKFALVTSSSNQFVAFYNHSGNLTVAQRCLPSEEWTLTVIPGVRVGDDSHCGIEMAMDPHGYLHLCANMHGSKLVYYRSRHPQSAATLEPSKMVGCLEDRCTYPQFITTERGDFVFMYRYGTCADGRHIVNKLEYGEWQRLTAIFYGEGVRNAYPVYRAGHIVYTWREDTDCSMNTLLCYAYTPDFLRWYDSDWALTRAPFTKGDSEVVDPVPLRGGLLNGATKIGWDVSTLVLSYHKYDENGILQVYTARKRTCNPGWIIEQQTAYTEKRTFSGPGTINKPLTIRPFDWPKPEWRLSWDKNPANRDQPSGARTSPLRVIHD